MAQVKTRTRKELSLIVEHPKTDLHLKTPMQRRKYFAKILREAAREVMKMPAQYEPEFASVAMLFGGLKAEVEVRKLKKRE